jgi:hypothetical protein
MTQTLQLKTKLKKEESERLKLKRQERTDRNPNIVQPSCCWQGCWSGSLAYNGRRQWRSCMLAVGLDDPTACLKTPFILSIFIKNVLIPAM